MIIKPDGINILKFLSKQIDSFFSFIPDIKFEQCVTIALEKCEVCFAASKNKYYYENNTIVFSLYHSGQYAIFLYYLSHALGVIGKQNDADMIYFLNKIVGGGIDWYHAICLPKHFGIEHPSGSILGRAEYGDYLFFYQRITVGGNRSKNGILNYPILGHHIVMYSNSAVIGDSHIGNYVIIAANTYIKDETIPDYCLVFGSSPNLAIKQYSESEMHSRLNFFWKTVEHNEGI